MEKTNPNNPELGPLAGKETGWQALQGVSSKNWETNGEL